MSTHSNVGSANGSSVQRRKTTRSKSKQKHQQQQQQQTQRNVAENVIENQNACNEQNERLHFRSRSATSESPASLASIGYNSPSPLCCNGLLPTTAASMLCCRDVNCHLNAPLALPLRGSVERSRRSESRQSFLTDISKPTLTPTPTASSASLTSASKKSRSRSRSCSCDDAAATAASYNADKAKQSSSSNSAGGSGVCESSSSSGDATAAQFTVSLHIDLFSWGLFLLAFLTRFYKLATPKNIV